MNSKGTGHNSVRMRFGSYTTKVDRDIAPMLRRLRDSGVRTLFSCQNGSGKMALTGTDITAPVHAWDVDDADDGYIIMPATDAEVLLTWLGAEGQFGTYGGLRAAIELAWIDDVHTRALAVDRRRRGQRNLNDWVEVAVRVRFHTADIATITRRLLTTPKPTRAEHFLG